MGYASILISALVFIFFLVILYMILDFGFKRFGISQDIKNIIFAIIAFIALLAFINKFYPFIT